MRLHVAGALVVALVLHAAPAFAAVTPSDSASTAELVETGSAVSADTTVAGVPQEDVFDLLDKVLKRRVEPSVGGTLSTGLSWAILPTISYNPVYGVALGAMISGAGQRGSTKARYSALSISGNVSTTGQVQAQVRGDVFSADGNYLVKADFRYLDTERSTWGLGPMAEEQQEYPMEFVLLRTYATFYRRASGPVFIGLGYHYDEFADIGDSRAAAGETTPYTAYSGGMKTNSAASGFSINVLGDTRDNLVNPSSGYYLSGGLRNYMTSVGSDANWQEMWMEMRVYPHLPTRDRNVLGFWLYTWLTFGETPYLNLPSDGWDTYGRGARGYLQGRIRGSNQIYLESEYRRTLTANGLWGAVAFLNLTGTTSPTTGTFGNADPGLGIGLRIKFNKRSNTNLAIDHGWGRFGSKGFFLGMNEVF